MRFRLRYLQHDLELNEGTFAVGRNASCQLSLDDPLVSRRHALFEVGPGGVTVEDLNSRNGVIVNSHRIEGKVAISVGDRILIGSQELTLLAARDPQNSGGIGLGKMTLPKMRVTTPSSGVPVMHVESDPEPSMVRRADQFKLLSGVAEKALAMGKPGAGPGPACPLGRSREGQRSGRERCEFGIHQGAAKFSAKLATATGKGCWADYVIELYQAQKRPCPAHVIDELYNAMRKVTAVDLNRLRSYLAMLRQNLPRYGPAERFLFQRLEGLERLAALR